jgi:hypothetical protein
MQLKQFPIIISASLLIFFSCGLPKETIQRIDKLPKEKIEFSVDYAQLFPALSFEQWAKDYNKFEKYLTEDILQTQMGLSYYINNVHVWWCVPSARTHVQLDTTTMISDNNQILGEWRAVCDRRLNFEDSVTFANKQIQRKSNIDFDNQDEDLYLSITSEKFKLFSRKKGKENFQRIANRNYSIESKRYLMLYGLSKAGAAISFIGIDKQGQLIIDGFFVQERKVQGEYIVYQAKMSQMIFKRMTEKK